MTARFNCWTTIGPMLRGKVRRILARAKASDRCDGFTETKGLLSSYFYVEGADEGLARQLVGNGRIDIQFAARAQEQANRQAAGITQERWATHHLGVGSGLRVLTEASINKSVRHCSIGKVAFKPRLAAE